MPKIWTDLSDFLQKRHENNFSKAIMMGLWFNTGHKLDNATFINWIPIYQLSS